MTSFAFYRLPREQQVTLVEQTEGEPLEFLSCIGLNGLSGFVVAPFHATEEQPILLIRPSKVETFHSESTDLSLCLKSVWESITGSMQCEERPNALQTGSNREHYAIDFANFHAHLTDETLRKVVLARCFFKEKSGEATPMELFQKACKIYPRLFIALVYTARSGLWLTASPEILLEGVDSNWRTIALAGTMKLEGNDLRGEGENIRWSPKNIQEQRIVANYITECLEHFASDFVEDGPRTVRAANLVHLRSDFTFTLLNNARVGNLLQSLHPTPAVCGLPKLEAMQFILKNEHSSRRYYSGFMGPLFLHPSPLAPPSSAFTHLYVSLRCMQITACSYCLYAGGGLLKDSVEEQEWLETEAKMDTMRNIIDSL